MDSGDVVLCLVVATALAFDFTNGFPDTANAMATSIATRALRPRAAVLLAAALNFVGAFISLQVAATIAEDIVDSTAITPTVILAGLLGGIFWNLLTWRLGLPSSSSHALIGGVVGAVIAPVLALVANGNLSPDSPDVPTWVVIAAATAIGLGTYTGGWRIIRTLGHRITDIETPQGFGAETSSAVVILAASQAGYPLSTTHVTSGGVIGAGVGKRAAEVRWGTARSMVAAWLLTIPAAGCIAGAIYLVTEGLGTDIAGPLAVSCLGAVAATALFVHAQRSEPVTARDV